MHSMQMGITHKIYGLLRLPGLFFLQPNFHKFAPSAGRIFIL